MIRDPSDGSVKQPGAEMPSAAQKTKPGRAENWGLKSLDEPKRKPKPAPTKEELAAHYREYNLGFQPKADEGMGEQ